MSLINGLNVAGVSGLCSKLHLIYVRQTETIL